MKLGQNIWKTISFFLFLFEDHPWFQCCCRCYCRCCCRCLCTHKCHQSPFRKCVEALSICKRHDPPQVVVSWEKVIIHSKYAKYFVYQMYFQSFLSSHFLSEEPISDTINWGKMLNSIDIYMKQNSCKKEKMTK